MGKINGTKVLVGGLLAGVVFNIGETILNAVVIREQFGAILERYGLPEMEGAIIGLFVLMMFLLGILSVWLYAAMRPRFGAGPRTAVYTGLTVWFLSYFFPMVGLTAMGFWDWSLFGITEIWGFAEILLGTLAGAWAYKEEVTAPAGMPAQKVPA
ncbi:MAG: hypothetical protein HY561_10020 [Gemmatimonadetes bacterium]|nr:hypothetical protein [Gemmatimonadota bacterium]